ncbi:solute carrier family 23 member 1-like [Ptychodera flava]|uniref:solute carrier family 23 member 1-like n=1 Tax=Ptychodera flava TaxID=63121 RepID=UPI003969DB88
MEENVDSRNNLTQTNEVQMDIMTQELTSERERRTAKEEAKEILANMKGDVAYGITESPRWYMAILLGFQHYLTMFGPTVAIPILLSDALCIGKSDVARSELIGTILFVSGMATLLQVLFGVRLPIVQGGTYSFLTPTFALLSLPQWQCPAEPGPELEAILQNMTSSERTELWQVRMREIQGAIMVASCFQVLIGFTGIIGVILRFIGPLAIAPTIALVGLSLIGTAADYAGSHWGISSVTMVLIIAFSQYLKNINIPCLGWSKEKGCSAVWYPIFKLFSVILAILLSWLLSYILTITDAIPDDDSSYGYPGRTDTKGNILKDSDWFRFPYPVQWGIPTVSAAGVFGMLAGVLASMIESIGDYYACARLAGAPPPPTHAVNRGIGMEGIGCILAGLWGTGNGTTSYSENIGAIGITKVGSRFVIVIGALIMMIFGMCLKFCALFVTIPDPIIGGVFCVMFGMITAVGISNLQFVDLNSSRNLFIVGFSIYMGLVIPNWLNANQGIISTGNQEVDQIITVLLSTSMFVGGLFGFILDNTIPGTQQERGLAQWRRMFGETADNDDEEHTQAVRHEVMKCYEFPFGNSLVHKWKSVTSYIPFCPTFIEFSCSCRKKKGGQENNDIDAVDGMYLHSVDTGDEKATQTPEPGDNPDAVDESL